MPLAFISVGWERWINDAGTKQTFCTRIVAVTNGPTYGAGFRINPKANPADGLFDVCSIDYAPLL